MRSILTIAKKDFLSIVKSPKFFIVSGICTLFWSFQFVRGFLTFVEQSRNPAMMMGGAGQSNIHYTVFMMHLSLVNLICIFAVPALTMSLLSEEKKVRTYDLLLTAPITATDIAIGKFLAGFGVASVLVGLSVFYPLATGLFAKFNWAPLMTAYLGIFLVVGLYAAVGLFASSLTESIMLSVFMGFIFNLTLWFIGQGSENIDSPTMLAIVEQISVGQQFMPFIRGTLKVSSVVFFTSFIGLFIFLTQRVVESSRWR